MPMMRVWRQARYLMGATLVGAALLAPGLAWAQAPCTHYAAPAGSGNGLTAATPFRINNFWAVARPGTTLCLLDGTYTGSSAIIEPPATLHGTAAQPITVRALNEGQVLIDAQGLWAVRLRAQWWVVEGINARNGGEFLFALSGAHNRARRIIGWNGTHGQADSNIWRVVGHDNTAEDVAGWGDNSRKIFDGAQGGNVGGSGFRRAWGEWNDHPQGGSQPNTTYQVSYKSSNQLFENVIGTWNSTGQVANAEAVMSLSDNCDGLPMDAEGTLVLGSIFYVAPGASYQPGAVMQGFCASGFTLVDVVAYVPQDKPQVRPFSFFHGGGHTPVGNACLNCLGVHAGSPSSNDANAGWSMPGFREGNSLTAATGGVSPFLLLPGLCKRYVDSELTDEPLWPWPMNQRIQEARILSGRPPVDVTGTIEEMLGPIPAACWADGEPLPPGPPPLPVVMLTVSPTTVTVEGAVTVTWANIATPSATDWLGLYAPGASNTAYLAWRYTNGVSKGTVPFTVPSTRAPGTYEVRLFSNDGYVRLAISSPIVVAGVGVTLSATPATVARGGTLTATWSGIPNTSARDWIGLYTPGAAATAYLQWMYVSCAKTASVGRSAGVCPFIVPGTVASGTYQLRLFANDGYTLRATSPNVMVQ